MKINKRLRKIDFTLLLFAILIIFGTAVGVYALTFGDNLSPPAPNTCTYFQTPYLEPSSQVCFVSADFFGVTCANYHSQRDEAKLTCGK